MHHTTSKVVNSVADKRSHCLRFGDLALAVNLPFAWIPGLFLYLLFGGELHNVLAQAPDFIHYRSQNHTPGGKFSKHPTAFYSARDIDISLNTENYIPSSVCSTLRITGDWPQQFPDSAMS